MKENKAVNVIQAYIALSPDEKKKLIQFNDFEFFRAACAARHTDLVKLLLLESETLRITKQMLEASGFEAFISACNNKKLMLLNYLFKKQSF